MINEHDIDISNMSYTNKDFGAAYTEILDYAIRLSKLWNPQSSNESDPGVVLLKLLAFMADKLNYNIDKNILEDFMASATQINSMRSLCDMMGYYMNYYRSASTPVTFTYRGPELDVGSDDSRNIKYITFPKYRTVLTNADSSLQYILWGSIEDGEPGDITLNTNDKTGSAIAIEGYLNTLNIGDSSKVTLENIDSSNRVYFGERQVAQNGILIRSYGEGDSEKADAEGTFWKRVENLNVQEPGALVYKFGYDSSRSLPYVEFPSDIANIIGDGLLIRYVISSGYYGNAGVGSINRLLSPTKRTVTMTTGSPVEVSLTDEDSANLLIKNNSAAVNGSDPEDIDSAYNNFKKTVGTFQTLVTCRDFANYIYSHVTDPATGNPLVSNIQTADRRTDINNSRNVVSHSELGRTMKNLSDEYSKLFIYPLAGINNPANDSEYKSSFLLKDVRNDIESFFRSDDSVANMSYEYVMPSGSDIALIKVLYSLDAKITTTYKVNVSEQLDIRRNVYNSLRKEFYSRNIDYGYEIPFDSIYNCIMNADTRIKSVSLKEPDLSVNYMNVGNSVMPIGGTNAGEYKDSPYLKVLSKNVLAGRLPLFEYDNRFSYEFGMAMGQDPIDNVESVTSETVKTLSADGDDIRDNEAVQFIGPKLVDEVEYGAYTNYYYRSTDTSPHNITPNVDTVLGANDKLLIVYTDTSKNQVEVLYTAGDIVRSTFLITPTDSSESSKVRKTIKSPEIIAALGTSQVDCLGVSTNQSIFERSIVRHTFNSTIKCAWLVNEDVSENKLADAFEPVKDTTDEWEYILGDSDYFIYSLDDSSSYEIFGSGTSLRLKLSAGNEPSDIFAGACDIPNLTDLYNNGIESLSGTLLTVTLSPTDSLTVQVNDILTLTSGDRMRLGTPNGDEEDITVDNSWKPVAGTVEYQLSGEAAYKELPPKSIGTKDYDNWRVRSRLDIITGPSYSQTLTAGQTVTFSKGGSTYPFGEGDRLRTNISLDLAGGNDVSLKLIDPNSIVADVSYPVSVLAYKDATGVSEGIRRAGEDITYYITQDELKATPFGDGCPVPHVQGEDTLFMLFVSFDALSSQVEPGAKLTISAKNADGDAVDVYDYATGDTVSDIPFAEKTTVLKTIKLDPTTAKLFLSTNNTSAIPLGIVQLGVLRNVSGVNSRFGLDAIEAEQHITPGTLEGVLLDMVAKGGSESEGGPSMFNYTAPTDKSEEIDEEDITSPYALYDKNNLANRFVLSCIDLDNSSIEITRSSKL